MFYSYCCLFSDENIIISTDTTYGYSKIINTPRSEFFIFDVQACSDAHIALSDGPLDSNESNAYEFVIGSWGNTRSAIRDGIQGRALLEQDTPAILSCSSYR